MYAEGRKEKEKEKENKSADWDAVCTILGWKWQSHGLNRERKRGSTKRYNDDDDIEASWWLPPIHHHPLLVGRSIHCDTDCLFPGFSRGREEKTASSDFLLLGLRDCRWVLQNEVTPPRHNKTMTSPRAHRETSIIPRIPLKNSLIERREPRSFLTSPHTHIGPLLCVRVKATTRHFYHPANPLISPFKDRRSDPLSLSAATWYNKTASVFFIQLAAQRTLSKCFARVNEPMNWPIVRMSQQWTRRLLRHDEKRQSHRWNY